MAKSKIATETTASTAGETEFAIIEVPVSAPLSSVEYAARSVELTLTAEQAATLKRIHKQLDAVGARMSDGRYITRPGHAVQWLLDQVVVSAG